VKALLPLPVVVWSERTILRPRGSRTAPPATPHRLRARRGPGEGDGGQLRVYLPKPVEPAELLAAVARLAERS